MSPDPKAAIWAELWDRLYHQGSIYPASPHILPYLLHAAQSWAPIGRIMPLALASAIVGADTFDPAGRLEVVTALARFAEETAKASEISRSDRVYMMSASLTLAGDRVWGSAVEHLNDEELPAVCPVCKADLYFRIGEESCVTVGEFNPKPQSRREPITPCAGAPLRDVAKWLYELAMRSDDLVLAYRIRCLFGTSTCTACGTSIRVDQAIERFEKRIEPERSPIG